MSAPGISAGGARPWGFWATIGWSALINGAFFLVQGLVALGFVMARTQNWEPDTVLAYIEDLMRQGSFLAVATCLSGPAGIAVAAGAVAARRGWKIREYLALHAVRPIAVVRWMAAAALFALFLDTLTFLLGKPVVPEFSSRAAASVALIPLLWFAFIIVAPLYEELVFRGFMFRGFMHSPLGPSGAVLLTAAYFGILHLQYDAWGMTQALAIGLFFGYARLASGSVLVTLCMHSLMNAIATLEAYIF